MKTEKHALGRFSVRISAGSAQKKNAPVASKTPAISAPRRRENGVCPVAGKCGGCALQGVAYAEQLRRKQRAIEELLRDFGGNVRPIIGMENPFHYRNKIHATFSRRRDGSLVSGIYSEGTHCVVPVDSCQIEDEKADEIVADLRRLFKSFKIKIYDERTGEGLLRHVLIRRAHATGQVMLVPVLTSPVMPSKNNFVRAIRELHPEIATIVINVNSADTSMVLGEREFVAFGKGFIEDVLCGKTFRISPRSFYQVNSVQTEKLYATAIELAGLCGSERVIDAYCGIGTIGIVAAARAGEVVGIELNPDAVRDAAKNAKINGVKNIAFAQGDAGEIMTQMAGEGVPADVVFMDPPRSGSTPEFLNALAHLKPGKIVYISCNPETLARDLRRLCGNGYTLREIAPVDMFPFTEHVETVALLTRTR